MGVKTLGHVLSACPKGQANATGKEEFDPVSVALNYLLICYTGEPSYACRVRIQGN